VRVLVKAGSALVNAVRMLPMAVPVRLLVKAVRVFVKA